MTTPFAANRLLSFLRRRRGSVGLEFGLLAPLVLLVLLGFYEAYMYLRTVALIERATASIANIISRQTASLRDCADTTDALNLGTYVAAAERVTYPLTLNGQGEVFLSAVRNQGNGPVVVWQRRSRFSIPDQASDLGVEDAAATLPADLRTAMTPTSNITVMVVELRYRFTPFAMTGDLWPDNPGVLTLSRAAYFRARTFDLHNLITNVTGCTAVLPTPPG